MGQHISDHQRVVEELERAGVRGAREFGYFVNDTSHFRPSTFDERAAMETLLTLLPTLSDPKVVASAAGHLRRPWARRRAFPTLLDAFCRIAPSHPLAGWEIGDALAATASPDDLASLLDLCVDRQLGRSRQMIVYSMWRFKNDARVVPILIDLLVDEDVCDHAASALRRSVGNDTALPLLVAASTRVTSAAATAALSRNIK